MQCWSTAWDMKAISTRTTTTNTPRTVITKANLTHPVTQSLRTSRSIPGGSGSRSCSLSSVLDPELRKYALLRSYGFVSSVSTQVDIPIFLFPYWRNSVRPSQISRSGAPIAMDPRKCETGFTDALFTEDYLPAREKGKSTPQLYFK